MHTAVESRDLAGHHAEEAEKLLRNRLGVITTYVKAQVHATLAVYYATAAEREDPPAGD